MTTVTTYSSADASAPVLTGQVGSVLALLDACLVNGYGSKPAAGWAIAFSGTNLRVYRSGNNANVPSVVYVDDTGVPAVANTAKGFAAYGGVVASAASYAGLTDPFPTQLQRTSGIGGWKSSTADATARDWLLFADDRTFYLFTSTAASQANGWTAFNFGEFFSYRAASGTADPYRLIISGKGGNVNGTELSTVLGAVATYGGSANMPTMPAYIARAYNQVAGAKPVKHVIETSRAASVTQSGSSNALCAGGTGTYGTSFVPYPNAVDGGLLIQPITVNEGGSDVRGHLRGVWCPLHGRPLTHGDTFSGVGALAGKTFMAVNARSFSSAGGAGEIGQLMIETSSTWDTN